MEMHTCVDVLSFHCCAYTGNMIMILVDIHNTLGSGVDLLIHDNSARIFSNSAAHFLAGVTMATSLDSWHRAAALHTSQTGYFLMASVPRYLSQICFI